MRPLALVTGEASGDLIARDALAMLIRSVPGLRVEGVGGAALAALGMDCLASSHALAVRGYVEVLQRLPALLSLRARLVERWSQLPPSLFLGVDAPDFNLGLASRLRARGTPTAHLVSPSIWAWRPERLEKIARAVDHMLCLFPMEPALYATTRVQAHYVGHPLADLVPERLSPEDARRALGLSTALSQPVLALLPGSRQSELSRLGPIFLETAERFSRSHQLILPAASAEARRQIESLPAYPRLRDLGLRLIGPESPLPARPASHLALEAADLALVASGTATLEAALFEVPQVVAYQVPWVTEQLMRRKAIVQHVSLPNLLLQASWVPELLQDRCTPDLLARALQDWQDQPSRIQDYQSVCRSLLLDLRQGAAARVAEVVAGLLRP